MSDTGTRLFNPPTLSAQEIHEGLVQRLRSRNADAARQIRRAADSVPDKLAEGGKRLGRDRIHHFSVAAGSPEEVREALEILDRIVGFRLRLTHGWPASDTASSAQSTPANPLVHPTPAKNSQRRPGGVYDRGLSSSWGRKTSPTPAATRGLPLLGA